MFSRYSIYNKSNVVDYVDLEVYPDPLSVNWGNFNISSSPNLIRIDELDIDRLWVKMLVVYGSAQFDDFILFLNNIPYRKLLSPGDVLFLPQAEDINTFINSYTSEVNS